MHTVEQSDRIFLFAREVKEELPNPVILKLIRIDRQRDSENLEHVLSSRLAKHLVVTFRELRRF